MEKLKMGKRIYNQYKSTVKGNEATTVEQAQLKMTRNTQLAVVNPRENAKGFVTSTHYQYGSLHFIVNNNDQVVWMQNYRKIPVGWKRDNQLYLKLNKELGIEEDVSHLDLVKRDAYYAIKKAFNKARYTWKKKSLQTV